VADVDLNDEEHDSASRNAAAYRDDAFGSDVRMTDSWIVFDFYVIHRALFDSQFFLY
jgi:hypothetical protein